MEYCCRKLLGEGDILPNPEATAGRASDGLAVIHLHQVRGLSLPPALSQPLVNLLQPSLTKGCKPSSWLWTKSPERLQLPNLALRKPQRQSLKVRPYSFRGLGNSLEDIDWHVVAQHKGNSKASLFLLICPTDHLSTQSPTSTLFCRGH